MDDCAVEFTASLAPIVTGNLCEPCDRTYQGSIDWIRETCNELLGNEGDLPTEATFGFRFISETSREVWGQNADQEWTKVADLGLEDGTWVSTTTSEIREDIEDCNNGVQYLGDLTITLSFTDAP